MTDERTWPVQIGSGWNTSDGYRFRREEKARAHQARVDDPDDEAGTHERTPGPPPPPPIDVETSDADLIAEEL